ncbi:apolipoprotein N-acyltransferase [Paracoccus benzoatiresistens]|uniref:Apolipoprotein N-acyltransferase n=1 Tax=Paracoccus benzoatiresistens TaxID=2997341 RepID=A0ABT4IZA2_9RHOB|nr:apolipoprotein N-acyltransferase [Paracoccus sp. EF6]MCZ0960196.1 apolipoprotein N-acyltransferase [Paracoccus sp. EF6]
MRALTGRLPLRQLGADLALGLVAALGLPPFGLWIATPLALALLIHRAARASGAFWPLLAGGLGWFGLSMHWIVEPFLVEPEIHGWMAPFALVLMALGGALFWAIPAGLAARFATGAPRRALAIASALVLSDWLRGWIFTGLPWSLTGHVWIDTPVAQTAAWTGAIGLSLMTLVLAVLPSLLRLVPAVVLALALTGGLWLAGTNRLSQPLPPDTQTAVRIVQPNAQQHLKWDPEWAAIFFQRLLDLSAAPGRRDLVIWPETAVNFLLEDAGPVLPAMAQAAGAPLVMGIQRRDGSRYYNSLVTLNPDATVGEVYDKFHLVPFGEYIPWGDALARIGITAFAAQQGNGYSAGPGPAFMSAPGAPAFQPLICYEAIFPQHLRGLGRRPEWLLQATNDAWFGQFSGPYQHLAQARLRAIESGLPLIRAANTGISAVIDPHGRIRQSLGLGVEGKIDAALPKALAETPWMKWGNTPVVLLTLLALAAALIRRKRG